MNFDLTVDDLLTIYDVSNQSRLAVELDVSRPAITQWKKTGVPPVRILEALKVQAAQGQPA